MKHLLIVLLLASGGLHSQKANAGDFPGYVTLAFGASVFIGATSASLDVDVNIDLRQDAREFIISNGVQYSELLNRMVELMRDIEPGITEEEVANRILLKKIIIK